MSRYCCYELGAWEQDGGTPSQMLRDELDQILNELCIEDYNDVVPENSHCIASFTTEAQGASCDVEVALVAFSASHPGVLIELDFACPDEEIHSKSRYLNGKTETVEAVVSFPPFTTLQIPRAASTGWILTDDSTLQHIRALGNRRFECIDSGERPNGLCFVCRRTIDLNEYDMDDDFCETYLRPYGYESETAMRRDYELAADQLIAECILETEMWEQEGVVHVGTEEGCRNYITKIVSK